MGERQIEARNGGAALELPECLAPAGIGNGLSPRNGGAALELPEFCHHIDYLDWPPIPQWRGSFRAARIAHSARISALSLAPQWRGSFRAARMALVEPDAGFVETPAMGGQL